jgi:putative oxidoreductase
MVFGKTTESDIDRNRLYVPAAGPLYTALAPYAWPMLRIALGVILITHGYPKLFLGEAHGASRNFVNFGWAYPLAWAYFIGVLEFFGGALLILGLFTRIIAAAVTIEMAVIAFAVLYPNWGWTKHGMEYVLLMGLVALALFIRGAGPLSIDSRMSKEF